MTIIKTFDTQDSPRWFSKKYIFLTVVCFLILTVVEIWASNTAVAFGEKYEKLSELEKNLKMENQLLENEIAENSSLRKIASKSSELGFSQNIGIQYIR